MKKELADNQREFIASRDAFYFECAEREGVTLDEWLSTEPF